MSALGHDLLDTIRVAGGEVQLIGRDRLKLVAPKALPAELVQRVRNNKLQLLDALGGSPPKPVAEFRDTPYAADQEERAAIIEHDRGAPRSWAEAIQDCIPSVRRLTFHIGNGGSSLTIVACSSADRRPKQAPWAGPQTICSAGKPADRSSWPRCTLGLDGGSTAALSSLSPRMPPP